MGFLFGNDNNNNNKNNNNNNKNKKNSKRKNEQMSEKDKAALQIKRQRDRLIKYEIAMQKKIDHETEVCRKLLRQKNKAKAKLVLRKKKYQQKLLSQAQGQLLNIEEMIENITSAEMQQEMLVAMKQGTELLQQINQEMDIDEVERLMDDTAEAIAYQQEINQILSENLTQADDDEVLKELAMIEEMEADAIGLAMPDAPVNNIVEEEVDAQQEEEEEEAAEAQPQKQKKQVLVQ